MQRVSARGARWGDVEAQGAASPVLLVRSAAQALALVLKHPVDILGRLVQPIPEPASLQKGSIEGGRKRVVDTIW